MEAGGVSVLPPMLPADFGGLHVFYSAETPGVLLDKITAALTSMKESPAVSVKHEAAKVGLAINYPFTSYECLALDCVKKFHHYL